MDPLLERFKEDQQKRQEFFKRFERIEELLKSIASSNQAILLFCKKYDQMEKMSEKK